MKKITYNCDICRHEKQNIIGITYVDLRHGMVEKSLQVGTNIDDANAHICNQCLYILAQYYMKNDKSP